MSAPAEPSGPRQSFRVPVVSAVIAAAVGVVAAVIPVISSRSAGREQAIDEARGAVDRSADLARQELRGWLSGRANDLQCLATDPHFEQEVATAIALVSPEDSEAVARAQAARTDEEHEQVQAALQKRADEAKARVLDRLKGFCDGRKSCKRVLVAHKSAMVVISTEQSDENGSLGGTLVSSALDSAEPVAHVSRTLEDQLGAPAVFASRSAEKNFVVLAAFQMDEVLEPLAKLGGSLGRTGRVVLADTRGIPLLGGAKRSGGKALELETLTKAIKGQAGVVQSADEEDKLVLAAYRPIPQGGLGLVVMRSREDIEDQAVPVQTGALFGAFALALLGAAGIALFGRRTLDGLRGLSETASRVAAGDLEDRAPVTGDDEVSSISQSFNAVLARLKKAEGGAARGEPADAPAPRVASPAPAQAPGPTTGPAGGASDRALSVLRERLVGAEDRHGIASGLLDVAWSQASPTAVAVYVRDPSTGAYAVLASRGMDPDKLQDLRSGHGAAGRAAATGMPVANAPMPDEEGLRLPASARREGLTQLALPIRIGSEVLGVLELIAPAAKASDAVLRLAADAAGLALSRLQEQARAARLAEQAERLLRARDEHETN